MALFVIGDVQGCLNDLHKLLQAMQFEPERDELWLTGDLVNRGPKSLEVLRFLKQLPRCVSVLGNHDLHLLAVAYADVPQAQDDTLEAILEAPDRDELLTWLRAHPLLHQNADASITMVHAGISPQWTIAEAVEFAAEAEQHIRSDRFLGFLKSMYGNKPARWSSDMDEESRLRYITNSFTRMRYVNDEMNLCYKSKGSPGSQAAGYHPWFTLRRQPQQLAEHSIIVFGHWSTLGYYHDDRVIALDSGCLWGHALTGVKLGERGQILQHYVIDCADA